MTRKGAELVLCLFASLCDACKREVFHTPIAPTRNLIMQFSLQHGSRRVEAAHVRVPQPSYPAH